jgi:hypothetical protein
LSILSPAGIVSPTATATANAASATAGEIGDAKPPTAPALNGGQIAGIAVGTILGLVVLATVLTMCFIRRRRKKVQESPRPDGPQELDPDSVQSRAAGCVELGTGEKGLMGGDPPVELHAWGPDRASLHELDAGATDPNALHTEQPKDQDLVRYEMGQTDPNDLHTEQPKDQDPVRYEMGQGIGDVQEVGVVQGLAETTSPPQTAEQRIAADIELSWLEEEEARIQERKRALLAKR